MVEELSRKQINEGLNGSPPSSLPRLNNRLNVFYNGLDSFNRGVFIKIYKYLWGVVNRKSNSLLSIYWALSVVLSRSSLTSSQLETLSYLYQVSNKGVNYVNSKRVYNGVILVGFIHASKMTLLNDLKRHGYITRHSRNPDEPYLQRSRSRQKVFIKLTLKGVQCIEGIEKDLNRLLLNSSLDDLTGGQ